MSEHTNGRAWDGYDVYLFDIDGTLLNCSDAVHYFAFCAALTSIAGRPVNLDGVTTQGNTDVGILRDAFALAGLPPERWRPRLEEAKQQMCEAVRQNAGDFRIEVQPAVDELLKLLKSKGKVLGVATGNLEDIGRAKLERCGLLGYFDFGGYSDAYETRHDVFAAAVAEARRRAGAGASICAIGDTPEDVRAARSNAVDVIAVSTGIFSYEQLLQTSPDWCLRSLEELVAP